MLQIGLRSFSHHLPPSSRVHASRPNLGNTTQLYIDKPTKAPVLGVPGNKIHSTWRSQDLGQR